MNVGEMNCILCNWNKYANIVEVQRLDGNKDSDRYSCLIVRGPSDNDQYIDIDCPVNVSDSALLDKLNSEYKRKITHLFPQFEYAVVQVISIKDAINHIKVSKTIGVAFALLALSLGGATNTEIIDGIEWTIALDTNTVTLEETGVSAYGVKPVDKSKVKGEVVVPSVINGVKVNRICDSAFYNCVGLTKVVISSGIEGIGRRSFEGCLNLSQVDAGEVKYICDRAFFGLGSLKCVVFPATLQWMAQTAFCDRCVYNSNGGNYHYYCGLERVAIQGSGFLMKKIQGVVFGGFNGTNPAGTSIITADIYTSEEYHEDVKTLLLQEGFVINGARVRSGWSIPAFNPSSGILDGYGDTISVDSASTNRNAKIYYTLDCSIPTNAVTANCYLYSEPIVFNGRITIKAVSYVDSQSPFAEVSTLEVGLGHIADTVIESSLGTDFGESGNVITLSCETEGAEIRYTLDGSEPTEVSPLYKESFSIDDTTTIKAKAFKEDWFESETVTMTFTREWHTVATPVIEPSVGEFAHASQDVAISCATDGATILYTTDESDPKTSGREYTKPFAVYKSCTVRAIAVKSDWKDSAETTATFTRSESLSEAANFYGYTMETGATAAWTVDETVSHDGVSSIRSNGSGSYVQTSVRGAGTLSFWWRAQCEEPDDGEFYDYGAFKVGSAGDARIAGNDTGWVFFSTNVTTTGKHILRWEYQKDDEGSYQPDCVWVDQVQWIPADGSGYTVTTPEPVPYSWLTQYNLGVAEGDFEAAGNAANGKMSWGRPMSVWQDYVAGTDPTNLESMLTAKIEMQGDFPLVTWEPNLNTNGDIRVYKVYGSETLEDGGNWQYPTNLLHRFFKVKVEMP